MSIYCIDWAIKHAKNRTPAQQVVLLVIANFANDADEAWPGVATIARITRLSRRSVQRAIRQLLECGDIATMTAGGGRRSNRYFLHHTVKGRRNGPTGGVAVGLKALEQAHDDRGAVTDGQSTCATTSHDPSLIRYPIRQEHGSGVQARWKEAPTGVAATGTGLRGPAVPSYADTQRYLAELRAARQ